MQKSTLIRIGLVVLLTALTGEMMGCARENESGDATDDYGDISSPEVLLPTGDKEVDASQPWDDMVKMTRMIALDDECCQKPGQADECWEQDALADNAVGFIFCNTDADCDGRPCNTGDNVKAALANHSGIKNKYTGMCECSSHSDCRNDVNNGGACFEYPDDGTGEPVNLCGPSMCNGYYVCSCWGGCTWWNGSDTTSTPSGDATSLGFFCCESEKYANPDIHQGLVTFGNAACSGSVLTIAECSVDSDCDTASVHNSEWNDQCVDVTCNTAIGRCEYTPVATNTECELDGLKCTVDRCTDTQSCAYAAARCPDSTYIDASGEHLNTCVNACVEGGTDGYTCNENRTTPSDATQDPAGICEWWTCEAGTDGLNIPILHQSDCREASDLSPCSDFECDPAGFQGNCNMEVKEFTPSNDTCAGAQSLGAFTTTDAAGSVLSVYGDTRCATNSHYVNVLRAPSCEDSSGAPMGAGSWIASGESGGKDLVYSFTYTASGSTFAAYRYRVRLESIWNSARGYFDGVVYASTEACNATGDAPYGVNPHDDCVVGVNSQAETVIREDDCTQDDGTDCPSIEGSALYAGAAAYKAETVVYEETSISGDVTVFVYVDGDSTISTGGGEFYLAVTKESNSDCPLPGTADFFYQGKVRRVIDASTYNFAIPINGVNFDPVDGSEQTQSSVLGNAVGIVVNGNTATAGSNSYNPLAGDADYDTSDPYAFDGYDELWELDIQADDVAVSFSLGDFGGGFDATPDTSYNTAFDPMLAVFNCHGERLDFNDNDRSLLDNPTAPQIRPASKTVMADGPYYVLVDGHYEYGTRGTRAGGDYNLAIFYDPVTAVQCDPTGVDAGTGYTLPLPIDGNEPATPSSVNLTDGCILIENSDTRPYECDGISFQSNNTAPGYQNCRTGGKYAYCMQPLIIKVTLWFSDSTDATKTCPYTEWLLTYDDHFNDIGANGYIELYDVHPKDSSCNHFDNAAVEFAYSNALTPDKLAICKEQCKYAEWIKLVDSNPCDFK